jgi:choline dehydrogenase
MFSVSEAVMSDFDYIIVGGGTAGCVLANRLTEDPQVKVAMLEAGSEDRGFWLNIPAGFGRLLRGSKFNWGFKTEPDPRVDNRSIVVPRGKGLGGSSLINGTIFARGQALDFDGWAQRGNPGWSFHEVLPYFKKLERFEDGGSELRGGDGPLDVVRVKERPELAEAFIEAAVQAGYTRNPDYNGADQDGFGYYQTNQRAGRRWSAAAAYLRPVRSRANLSVITGAQVLRLDVAGRQVTGVAYRKGGLEYVIAGGEILLAAGAIQSPHLLELSGIGDPHFLKGAGVEVLHASPGVGANYADHYCTRMNWRVTQPITLNELTRGLPLAKAVAQYFLTRRGVLSLGTGLAHGFVRTRPELETPDVQYFFMHASYANAGDRKLDNKPGMTIGVAQLRPESRGAIHLKSADPLQPPAIRPNFLDSSVDRDAMVEGMRIARDIVSQSALKPYVAFEMSPGSQTVAYDDWLSFARRNGQTIYHPVGTCSMGQGSAAVVDERLRVRGVSGLRVVDASIMPTQVSANTMAAVLMIAEKAADMIREDRRLK